MPSSISKQSGKLWGKNGSAYHRLGKCWVYKKEIREGYITRWQNGGRHNKKTQVNKQEKMNRKNQAFLCVMGLKHSERKGNKKKEDLHLPFWFAYKKNEFFPLFAPSMELFTEHEPVTWKKDYKKKYYYDYTIYTTAVENNKTTTTTRGEEGKKTWTKTAFCL